MRNRLEKSAGKFDLWKIRAVPSRSNINDTLIAFKIKLKEHFISVSNKATSPSQAFILTSAVDYLPICEIDTQSDIGLAISVLK